MTKLGWMNVILMSSLMGCQTAAKKDGLPADLNLSVEDHAFREEALEAINSDHGVSTLMSIYQDEIKAGKIRLEEIRNAERKIAGVDVPALVRILSSVPAETKAPAMAGLLREINILGPRLAKDWSNIANEAGLATLSRYGDDVNAKLAKSIFSKPQYKALISSNKNAMKQFTQVETYITTQAKIAKTSTSASSSVSTTAKLEEAVKKYDRLNTTVTKAKNTITFDNPVARASVKKAHDRWVDSVRTNTNLSASESQELIVGYERLHDSAVKLHNESNFWVVNNSSCQVLNDVKTQKTYIELVQKKTDDVVAWKKAHPGKAPCPAVIGYTVTKFQIANGRGTDRSPASAYYAGAQMGKPCPTGNSDVSEYLLKAAEKNILLPKSVSQVSCPVN